MKKNIVLVTIAAMTASAAIHSATVTPDRVKHDPASETVLAEQLSSNHACTRNCRLEIVLPEDIGQAPMADEVIQFADPSGELNVDVDNRSSGNGATVLRFEGRDATPFMNRGGAPMTTVPLRPGRNSVQVRPYSDGVCHGPDGCKYDVINSGEPGRPVLDPVIIIDDPVD